MQKRQKGFSLRSLRQSPTALVLDSRLADQSSRPTRAVCGHRRGLPVARSFNLHFPFVRATPMPDTRPIIYVVDDDASVRDAISNLLESIGLRTKVFVSTEAFWKAPRPDVPSCLVLDVRLPGASGLEFQEMLIKNGVSIPIIFITAHGDVPMTSRAMKAGAIEFLMKPFQKEELLAAVCHGLERDRIHREEEAEVSILQSRVDQLSSREREVMDLVVTGLINKQIGTQLGLSEVTVKAHRSHVMQKMGAASLAELVRMSDKLKPRDRR